MVYVYICMWVYSLFKSLLFCWYFIITFVIRVGILFCKFKKCIKL